MTLIDTFNLQANGTVVTSRRRSNLAEPFLLNLIVSGQINLFRQGRPFTHPRVDLLRLAIAGQRLRPIDVVTIHDLWLVVEMRRDGRGERRSWLGGSARRLTRSLCVEMV